MTSGNGKADSIEMTRQELITLTGQITNGILSADNSLITKLIDRTIHKQIADTAVSIAKDILTKIDQEFK